MSDVLCEQVYGELEGVVDKLAKEAQRGTLPRFLFSIQLTSIGIFPPTLIPYTEPLGFSTYPLPLFLSPYPLPLALTLRA